jgi:hypothetical protein
MYIYNISIKANGKTLAIKYMVKLKHEETHSTLNPKGMSRPPMHIFSYIYTFNFNS